MTVVINENACIRTAGDQALQNGVSRAIQLPIADGFNANPLPLKAERVGKFLAFDAGGQPVLALSSMGADSALRVDLAAATGAALIGTTGGRSQQQLNSIVIRPERFGAIGDGVADDTAAVQAALDYATTQKKPLVCDGKYKLTGKILGTTLWGLTSIGSGEFIITFDDDVFEFSGAGPNSLLGNLTWTYKVATASNKNTIIFKYQYHVMGLKVEKNNINGFTNCGWNFLKIKKISGTGGFFGGFCYRDNRSLLINNDIDLENADWVNSGTFSNNFKFYGNYAVYVGTGCVLYDYNIHGWWGQETNGIINAVDGQLNKCSIIGVLNWDTNTVAINLGVNTRANTIEKVYEFDITDLGYMNNIVTADNIYTSNASTAISNTRFTEIAVANKNSFLNIFNTVATTGDALARNGIVSIQGTGLKHNAFWLRVGAGGGTYLLDTLDKTVMGIDLAGKYDVFSALRFFLDFTVGSTDMDDKSIKIGMGTAVNTATPVAGTFLTNIGGNFVIATFDGNNVATTLYSLGAIKLGRNQVQFISPAYQSGIATTSAIHFNNNFVGRFTLDTNTSKRPIIQLVSTSKVTTVGLLRCDMRNTCNANLA